MIPGLQFVSLLMFIFACSTEETVPQPDIPTLDRTGFQQTAPPTAGTLSGDDSVQFARILTNSCGIPDPAIDRANPHRGQDLAPVVHEIHAGLTSLPPTDPFKVEPELASSYTVSDESQTYEFSLRQNLKFSDGSPLNASDVKWSWERALRMSHGRGRATRVLGKVAGANDIIGRYEGGELLGVEVIDDRRLIVRLVTPNPMFPAMISDPIASVLKETNVESWPIQWDNRSGIGGARAEFKPNVLPVGAGPFKLEWFESEGQYTRCRLVSNEHYWGETPQLDSVDYLTFSQEIPDPDDYNAVVNRLMREGRIDWIRVAASGFDDLAREMQPLNVQPHIEVGPPAIAYLAFNPSVAPFDDVNFRRALIAASDVSPFDIPGSATTTNRLMPLSLQLHESEIARLPYDPADAHTRLESVDLSSNVPIIYHSAELGWFFDSIGKVFDGWFDILGINVLHSSDDGSVPRSKRQMLFERYTPEYPDPHAVLARIPFLFDDIDLSSEQQRLQALIDDATSERDDAERARKYDVAEEYILEQALVLPVWNFESPAYHLLQPWVHNFHIPRYAGSVFRHIELSDSVPAR